MIEYQIKFMLWLVTSLYDKCQTVEEVRDVSKEIRSRMKTVAL